MAGRWLVRGETTAIGGAGFFLGPDAMALTRVYAQRQSRKGTAHLISVQPNRPVSHDSPVQPLGTTGTAAAAQRRCRKDGDAALCRELSGDEQRRRARSGEGGRRRALAVSARTRCGSSYGDRQTAAAALARARSRRRGQVRSGGGLRAVRARFS